jgi:hypothetical protein
LQTIKKKLSPQEFFIPCLQNIKHLRKSNLKINQFKDSQLLKGQKGSLLPKEKLKERLKRLHSSLEWIWVV